MHPRPEKLYCYVDETGQDTLGILFIVGLLVISQERTALQEQLAILERVSKKRDAKWTRAHYRYRRRYIEGLLQLPLRHSLFVKHFSSGKQYLLFTADAIITALRPLENTAERVIVYVDGFPLSVVQKLKRQLRPSLEIKLYVKTIARDESSSLMRLADALCGLVRDSHEGNQWAQQAVKRLEQKQFLASL